MARRRSRWEEGHSALDVVVGLVLFSLVVLTLYQVFIPTIALSSNTTERLERQQDVRLAVDRLARELHETTLARLTIYTTGCAGAYEGCIGYATARTTCVGAFQLTDGFPNWQAAIYVWRDAGSNELRRWCDPTTTIPSGAWPPGALTPYTVVARQIDQASFTLTATGLQMSVRERAATASRSSRRYQTEFLNRTVFVPQNR
jgi:hypothetical protein